MSDKYSQLRELYEAELQETGRNFAKGHSFESWVEHRRAIAEGSILERNARLRARGVLPVETAPHSCEVCESDEYLTAASLLLRNGLKLETWGGLLHDIARALQAQPTRKERTFLQQDAARHLANARA